MVGLVVSDASAGLAAWAGQVTSSRYGALITFVLSVGILRSVIVLPLGFLSGYVIEHKFRLSHQSLKAWAWERLKGVLVGFPLTMLLVIVVYYCLERFALKWWLPVGLVITLMTIILARLAPVLLFPLFYRFVPLENGTLKERLLRLCRGAGVAVEGIFTFDLSKNTRKANAGFTGIGKSRRIVLGDTLIREFTEEEIETVFAHELGHYRYHHIRTGILVGTLSTFGGLFCTSQLYAWSVTRAGFSALTDLGALPLLGIWLSLFALATAPVRNALARRHERQADRYAVRTTGKPGPFAAALRKLADQNLADPDPHPVIEFLMYSHPSITRRVRMVEAMTAP